LFDAAKLVLPVSSYERNGRNWLSTCQYLRA
jgi:hypothetical protein